MIRRPPRSTQSRSSAASDVYKRQPPIPRDQALRARSIDDVPVYLPPEERRDDPTPLRTDDRRTVLVGTAVWLALLVGTLVSRDGLVDPGRGWWAWSCLAGG